MQVIYGSSALMTEALFKRRLGTVTTFQRVNRERVTLQLRN